MLPARSHRDDDDDHRKPRSNTKVVCVRMDRYEHVGRLYKKRGGMGRRAKSPWVSRTFALSPGGVLEYYDTGNLRPPSRGSLNLVRAEAVVTSVEDFGGDDTPTKHMMIITHIQGQRWKLCAESLEDLAEWREKLAKYSRSSNRHGIPVGRPKTMLASPKNEERWEKGASSALRPVQQQQQQPQQSPRQQSQQRLQSPRPSTARRTATPSSASRKTHSSKVTKETVGGSVDLGEVVRALVVVNFGGLVAWTSSGSAAGFAVAAVLVNAYVVALVARSFDQAPPTSETLVSLIVPPARLPPFVSSGSMSRSASDGALCEDDASSLASMSLRSMTPSTTKRVAGATGLREVPFADAGGPPGTWSVAPADTMKLRQRGYAKSKRKAPSGNAFFEVVSIDLFDTETRVDKMSEHVAFPSPAVISPDSEVPSTFVVNAQVPSETGPLRVKLDADGHGYQVVICMQMTRQTREDLLALATDAEDCDDDDADDSGSGERSGDKQKGEDGTRRQRMNALKLLKSFCRNAPNEPQLAPKERGRFKVLAQVRNIDEVAIPNFAKGYNGKPALIAKTGTLTRGHDLLEMDINIHAFGYLARAGLQSIYRDFQEFILSIGFVIEGRDDKELPEVLLSACDLNHCNWTMAAPL